MEWTEDGWIDTLEEEKIWDEDEYYAHIDNLDFDLIDRMPQVCCRCSLLCMDLRMIRSPPPC